MIKAGSLYYAIIICVLVGVCCAAFMLTSHYSKMHGIILQTQSELLNTNTSGIQYFLNKVNRLGTTPEKVDFFENGIITEGSITNWGFYKVLKVRSVFKRDTIVRHALLGKKYSNPPALYLVDNDKPVQMVGKAKIKGDAYLPKKGIKKGYITSQSFSSFTFLEGNKLRSGNKLPIITGAFSLPDTVGVTKRTLEEIKKGEIINQSFTDRSLQITVSTPTITNKIILGNVVISAKDSLFITRSNKLEDVVIMAPIVVFEKGFTGTVQVFSNEKVELEEDVVLKYPSGIYMDGTHLNNREVLFNEDSKFLGSVVVAKSSSKAPSLISVAKNAQIIGSLYCDGNTDLKGSIIGSVYTDKFYLKTEASTYENYIEDGQIDQKSLSKDFLGCSFSKEKELIEKYGVVKML
ncbi:hypothetical protein [uncultured Maribacter sp.]|uniref:hypothetical protein n=1 Tax=uncultured Maribacter sp. TaxID=431308 RepID=UPI00262FB310|nr:hypothetical protein [uncultured Maribacter sp.]